MAGPSLSAQPRRVQGGTGALRNLEGTTGNVVPFSVSQSAGTGNRFAWTNITQDDWALYQKLLRFVIRFRMMTADVAPASSLYLTLFPVAALTGATNAANGLTLGAEVVAARTATVGTPAANGKSSTVRGPEFILPTDDAYTVCAVIVGANFTLNSVASIWWSLDAVTD